MSICCATGKVSPKFESAAAQYPQTFHGAVVSEKRNGNKKYVKGKFKIIFLVGVTVHYHFDIDRLQTTYLAGRLKIPQAVDRLGQWYTVNQPSRCFSETLRLSSTSTNTDLVPESNNFVDVPLYKML